MIETSTAVDDLVVSALLVLLEAVFFFCVSSIRKLNHHSERVVFTQCISWSLPYSKVLLVVSLLIYLLINCAAGKKGWFRLRIRVGDIVKPYEDRLALL